MTLRLIKAAAELEDDDAFHIARLIILIRAAGKKSNRPVDGIMKLAKLDFLLRYPNCLERALKHEDRNEAKAAVTEDERGSIEAKMIRFKYGPWDSRYRKWIGILVSKGLARTFITGRTINIVLTDKGLVIAQTIDQNRDFKRLQERSKLIATAFGDHSSTALKTLIYAVFPEIASMKWGEDINL